MLSAVKRYRALVAGVLQRCFPRTSAHLREEDELLFRRWGTAPGKANKAATAKRKGKPAAKAKPKSKSEGPARAAGKPRGTAAQGIYAAAQLKVDDAQVQAMRERVEQAVAAGIISAPSEEQWAMILSRSPVTRIFAGAGSGKSTTLLLRVVFMLCHMGIEPGRLTVISFTNASCAQLREQLVRVLGFWQVPFDAQQARQCVRTFHSAMAQLAREVLERPVWFEQLDDKAAAADEPDNPLATARLRPAQVRLLKQAYQQCYAEQATFRELVHRLLDLPAPQTESEQGKRAALKAPGDTFTLAGEFTPLPLYEAFYAQAGFIESIGIRIDQLQPGKLQCAPRERDFVKALVSFHGYFRAALREQGLMTFNEAFQQLTERLASGSDMPQACLVPFENLLIDEFQDISPQIVQWLQALHRQLARQKSSPSLMAIGDDWQSIYGWRGSSPELFMDFDKYFPRRGAKGSETLLLETNYRSIEPVIRDGEAVLAGVQFKQAKTSRPCKPTQPGDHGVKLVTGFELNKGLPKLIEAITAQCAHVAERQSRERTAVLLLSRRNEPLRTIQAQLDRKLPVKAYTIHRAKGLQAEVAIIVDDCAPVQPHPLRNALYAYSGFFRNSYDQAMADESLRLGYVAITRGVSRVFWYTRKAQGATERLARRG
ncbi:DNA/RNA helicase [Stutzerimonas stutzeri]|uniref:DEAD/DEAH box helicase n=1 Tax=Stutzerimonas stutzeri subgroup TaxID=578833 RepID=UPI000C6D4FBA|nr:MULTISPECIES: DEAD/DEAH box helicase [Stutzerimonas stutzeri subgroup]MCQ2046064.1 DEAD/DEAH box helicase [Stutzerimonas kunmingensis]PKR26770.1 DNA helicase UvrD [Stutzerimonas stutzeri]QQC09574.1 DEAD/DEAH box helicase [Stutzerimonas stutzeri]VEI34903.1 DNA/RNA helicase [Stutzerimonas stutzeri]